MKKNTVKFIKEEKQRNGTTLYVFKVGKFTIKTPQKNIHRGKK